jgi:hypothetical protein
LGSLFLIGLTVAGGCRSADPAVKRSEQTADVLVDTSQSLAMGEQVVVESQAALRTLSQAKGDLRPAFDAFMLELDAVRKSAARTQRDGDMVKAQSTLYCDARQSDIRTISNDEMRQVAETRTARVREQCNNIKERYAQVNASYASYIRNLADLQTYLANELNYGALDSGQRWVDEAIKSGEVLRSNIRALALQVELTSNTLSPVPIATTRFPSMIDPGAGMVAEQR